MKRILACMFSFVLFFSGCNLFGTKYNSDEELYYTIGRDSAVYQYSDKVKLYDSYDNLDKLLLRENTDSYDGDFFDDEYIALSGDIEQATWVDYELIFLMDNMFYVFDIEEYTIPPCDENGNETFELIQYSAEEFKTHYPDYLTFEWEPFYTFSTSLKQRREINKMLPFTIPYSAKILEFCDTEDYTTGKLAISCDEYSDSFIDTIKNEWTKQLINDENYHKINNRVFRKGLMDYSDDYYYFYDIQKPEHYYGEIFNVFAYDEENMVLYFYISD